jgi:hypothetical protein
MIIGAARIFALRLLTRPAFMRLYIWQRENLLNEIASVTVSSAGRLTVVLPSVFVQNARYSKRLLIEKLAKNKEREATSSSNIVYS